MKRKIPDRVLEFIKEMQPGDEVHFIKAEGKIGYKLMKQENPGEWSTEFVETGIYGTVNLPIPKY